MALAHIFSVKSRTEENESEMPLACQRVLPFSQGMHRAKKELTSEAPKSKVHLRVCVKNVLHDLN